MRKDQLDPRPALAPIEKKEKGPIRKGLEEIATSTYTALKPAVDKVKGAVVGGLKTYLDVVDGAAEKIKPYADKLPKAPQRSRGRRGR